MTQKLTFVNGAKAACGCRHEFSSGGGEYSDVASVHLCAMHAGSPVLDDRWKARMLDGRAPERDEMGFGNHPELPSLDEGMMPRSFFAALGLELAHTSAEDQLDGDVLGAMSEAVNWTDWLPTPPHGDGWKLVSIFDTEDGPVAWWLRELPEAEDGTTTIRILQAEVEKLKARIARAGAAPAAVAPQTERQFICPTRTVADLVNNLLTLDQALPVFGAQYIEKDGRRCAIAVPPTVSRERVLDGRWIGQGEDLNAAVVWTRAEQPAAVAGPALGTKFFSASNEGLDEHDTAEAAQNEAQSIIDMYREEAADGWPEEVDSVCWGVILGKAVEMPVKDAPFMAGILGSDMEPVDYVLEPVAAPALEAPADEFRGDTPSLVRNIVALLELDADGALVPHGVGGHARGLLSAAAARLAAAPQAPAAPDDAEMLAALQAVAMDVVHVGAGENTISDAARAKVEAVLEQIGAPWPGPAAAPAEPVAGNWVAASDVDRLVRELDVALHGESDAAPQASLCDIVGLAKAAADKLGRPVLAAPAAPAVDASPLLAPETELDAVVRDAEQIIRDAEHYRFIKRHRLILSGGTDTFGWPIAPFGDECDRYIAQELATERAAQAAAKGEHGNG